MSLFGILASILLSTFVTLFFVSKMPSAHKKMDRSESHTPSETELERIREKRAKVMGTQAGTGLVKTTLCPPAVGGVVSTTENNREKTSQPSEETPTGNRNNTCLSDPADRSHPNSFVEIRKEQQPAMNEPGRICPVGTTLENHTDVAKVIATPSTTTSDNNNDPRESQKVGGCTPVDFENQISAIPKEDDTSRARSSASETKLEMKQPKSSKKGSKSKLSRPQLLSDLLSFITDQSVVLRSNGTDYYPYNHQDHRHRNTLRIMLENDDAEIQKLPSLPQSFRDVAKWYARAYAASRNGFQLHLMKISESDQQLLREVSSMVMDQLSVQALKWLQSDDTMFIDIDEEESLFSDYLPGDEQNEQNLSPALAFLSLLEEVPSPVGGPFLNNICAEDSEIAAVLLSRALRRFESQSSVHIISNRTTAIVALIQSPLVRTTWINRMQFEASQTQSNGSLIESTSWLRPILRTCAFCVPERFLRIPKVSDFHRELEHIENFPVSVFERNNPAVAKMQEEMSRALQSVQSVVGILLQKGKKENLFKWLACIVRTNEDMTLLPRENLLENKGASFALSSQPFLLGLAASVVGMCSSSLDQIFAKDSKAFDYRYLLGRKEIFLEKEVTILPSESKTSCQEIDGMKFDGGTEMFFLTSALLRISLYPVMVLFDSFSAFNKLLFDAVNQASSGERTLARHEVANANPAVADLFGWDTFLNSSTFAKSLTDFATLQLRWLVANTDRFSIIPEWMCKNPATWLSYVASRIPHLLRPYQAISIIECAMQLLQVRSSTNETLSPVAMDVLVQIIASFAHAGVHRHNQRNVSRAGDSHDDVSMYLSFDQNDLGVTVFTNELVTSQLCPLLMQIFGAVDVVEGLDVDREHGFDKYSTKHRIAELFLFLWSHPNGMCRNSVLHVGNDRISTFVKEVELAIGVVLDFSCNRLADVCNGHKSRSQSADDIRFLLQQAKSATNELYLARYWFQLLCKISEEPKIRYTLGTSSAANELASLIIHFLDVLTDPDGGIHRDLDLASKRSSDLTDQSMTAAEKQDLASHLTKCRYLSRARYGLDVASLSHQCMALVACWHSEARDESGSSRILCAFASHDDFDEHRFRNIVKRLVAQSDTIQGKEGDCASTIFEHDGYVDWSIWEDNYKLFLDESNESVDQHRIATQHQCPRAKIHRLASVSSIMSFLDDAAAFKSSVSKQCALSSDITNKSFVELVNGIVFGKCDASVDSYSKLLAEWLVTSESFLANRESNTFAHVYNNVVRSRSVVCPGKVMVKEARRCHKNLPAPHPNSAAFACFAEERMDLCRACITGPVDSPYAHGIFVFEVFFPAGYPNIPPLVTFMTTGGGQTRFNPNLYPDGKVCLSLLGTFHAMDTSQKWNPGYSSLAQVLLSIQTQLLVEDPYFNEPGNDVRRGSTAGTERSIRYNQVIQLATLRHAILAHLHRPPVGLEEICLRHFRLCRRRIVVQARRWMLQAKQSKSTLYPRFERSYVELVTVLAELYHGDEPSLAACLSDLKALEALEPSRSPEEPLSNRFKAGASNNVVLPSGAQDLVVLMTAAAAANNPWASTGMSTSSWLLRGSEVDVDDEELYE